MKESASCSNQSQPIQLARQPEPHLMSRKQAAAYLGVSDVTLAIWKSTGRYNLPVYKVGRLAKYKKSDLDAFIASRQA